MAHDSPHPVAERLLILLASLGGTQPLAELGARVVHAWKGDGWHARAARDEMRRTAGGMDVDPRRSWPRRGRCALPSAPVRGRRGARLKLVVSHLDGRSHLPLVELGRAASRVSSWDRARR